MLFDLISELFSTSSEAERLAEQLVSGGSSYVDNYPFAAFITAAVFCFLFGAVCAGVYSLTKRDEPTSWNYVITLAALPAVICMLVWLVHDNVARALGLTGIFALVRFRSVPSDPKDLGSIVFMMACGAAGGLKMLAYAGVVAGLYVVFLLIAWAVGLARGASRTRCKLKITVPENMCWDDTFDEVLQQYTRHFTLARVKTVELGSFFELAYDITLKPGANEKEMIDAIRTRNGNLTVLLNKYPDAAYEL